MPISRSILSRISNNDPSLIELNLTGQYPPLNAEDMKELAAALKTNTHLETLILCDNEIKDEGAKILATSLANCFVKTVDVSINGIGNIGISALIQSPTLSLDIAGNNFSDDGLNMLARATLRSLFIHENGLTDNCAQHLLANTSLLEITLDNNQLTPSAILSVQQHIQQNILSHLQKVIAEQLMPYVDFLSVSEKLAAKQQIESLFSEAQETEKNKPPSFFGNKSPFSGVDGGSKINP